MTKNSVQTGYESQLSGISNDSNFNSKVLQVDIFSCPLDYLIELIDSAPDIQSVGYLHGVLSTRQHINFIQSLN